MADIPDNSATNAVVTGSGTYRSAIEVNRDVDWWRVDLTSGLTYDFRVTGDGSAGSTGNLSLRLLDGNGVAVTSSFSANNTMGFTPVQSGTYYLSVADSSIYNGTGEGNYILTANMSDRVLGNVATTARITGSGTISGELGQVNDSDWYRVELVAGQAVGFRVSGDGSATSLGAASLALRDSAGVSIKSVSKDGWLMFTPTASGTYYVSVADGSIYNGRPEGNFRLTSAMDDRIADNSATTGRIAGGWTIDGRVDAPQDRDWYRMETTAGTTYSFTLTGDGSLNSLGHKGLSLRNADGVQLHWTTSSTVATYTWTATVNGPVFLSAGSGSIYDAQTGNYRLSVISSQQRIDGTARNDVLDGDKGNNKLFGYGGDDHLRGNDGDDVLKAGPGNDTIDGGAGFDTAYFTNRSGTRVDLNVTGPQNTGDGRDILISIEGLVGGAGNDHFRGNAENNALTGGLGNDSLLGLDGNDTLIGGQGDDLIDGGAGIDRLRYIGPGDRFTDLNITTAQDTGEGRDIILNIENITGGSGNDHFIGDGQTNVLVGNFGNDTLDGRDGNDFLNGGLGNDVLIGGAGIDTVLYDRDVAVRVDLALTGFQNTGAMGMDRLIDIERVTTAGGNDRLAGDRGDNVLRSNGGNDYLDGRAGNDSLDGGTGNDTLIGGAGNDTLTGGSGADVFIFARGAGHDRITDFAYNEDRIDLRGMGLSYGDLTMTQRGGDLVIAASDISITLVGVRSWHLDSDDFLF